jgi:AraC family transcriptional regulator
MKQSPLTQREYEKRMNRVLDFINKNLNEDIRLETLSDIACFSPFHFHRIFTALIGESPADFVRRLRLERAANQLLATPLLSVTDVAFGNGFTSSAQFSRLFRQRFGMSPSAWRLHWEKKSKNRQAKSKKMKAADLLIAYNKSIKDSKRRSRMNDHQKNIRVEVKHVPSKRIAYVKHLKGYEDSKGIGEAFQKLFLWAGPRGFMNGKMHVLGMSLDNPDITPKDRCRYYACVTVSEEAEPEGEVGIMNTHGGTFAVARFKGKRDVFKKAYDYMYGAWLPQSGYQPDDYPGYEVYLGEPDSSKDPVFEFELYVPLRPL